jgi:hypothetical protein
MMRAGIMTFTHSTSVTVGQGLGPPGRAAQGTVCDAILSGAGCCDHAAAASDAARDSRHSRPLDTGGLMAMLTRGETRCQLGGFA